MCVCQGYWSLRKSSCARVASTKKKAYLYVAVELKSADVLIFIVGERLLKTAGERKRGGWVGIMMYNGYGVLGTWVLGKALIADIVGFVDL